MRMKEEKGGGVRKPTVFFSIEAAAPVEDVLDDGWMMC